MIETVASKTRQAPDGAERTVVLHSVRQWLQPTKTWIYEQLRWLPPEIEAHVACETLENAEQFPFERLHVLAGASRLEQSLDRVGRRAHLGALRSAAALAVRLSAGALHSHFGPEAWREIPIARAAGLPQVVTFYGYDVTRVPIASAEWRRRYRELFESAALVLCEGPHMRDELLRLGADPDRTRVQHLGVDIARFEFSDHDRRAGGPLRLLLAAAFREKKGLPDALRAIHAAQQARPQIELRVTVVGDAVDDPASRAEKQRIVDAAALLGTERVTFLGFQPYARLVHLAREHDVFVSPSVRAADGDTEGGAPVTLIELAATGLPVISTTHCDIPNVLSGSAGTLLAAEHDVAGLAERLLWAIDHPEECREIARAVRAHIERQFDARKQAVQLAQLYRELARRGSRPGLAVRARTRAETAAGIMRGWSERTLDALAKR
jgi:colanic acid/amylovoran biosynthesis glycosyltransferase